MVDLVEPRYFDTFITAWGLGATATAYKRGSK